MEQTPTKLKRSSAFIRAVRALQAEFNARDCDTAASTKPQRNTWNGPAYEYNYTSQTTVVESQAFISSSASNDDSLPSKRHTVQGEVFDSARREQRRKFTPDDYNRKYRRSVILPKQILEEMFFDDEIWTDQRNLPTERFICTITAVPDYRSQLNKDVLCIKEASLVMPLRDFLSWLPSTYGLQRLTHERPLSRKINRTGQMITSKDCYHELIALEAQYDLDISAVHKDSIQQIICSIQSTLKWLRVTIEGELALIEEKHRKTQLREFLAWCYDRYRIQSKSFFRQSEPWNPHYITSTTRVKKGGYSLL